MRKRQDTSSAVQRELPLRLDELDNLIEQDGKRLTGNRDAILTFLYRVRNSMVDLQNQSRLLTMEVEKLRKAKGESEHPIQRALNAINDLDEEQKREVLDRNYIKAVDDLEKEKAEALLAKTAAKSQANRVKMLLGQLLKEDMPADSRAKVQEMLDSIGL